MKFIYVLFLIFISGCSGGAGSGRGADLPIRDSADLLPRRAEVQREIHRIKSMEEYGADGELKSTTTYFYGVLPFHPSYQVVDAQGVLLKKVDNSYDSHGYLRERKTFEYDAEQVVSEKLEDFERDEQGHLRQYTQQGDGHFRKTEYTLSDEGREQWSFVYDAEGRNISQREINWRNQEVLYTVFDAAGKPHMQTTSRYLRFELSEGQLRTHFLVSQKKDNLTEKGGEERMTGRCQVAGENVQCIRDHYDRQNKLVESSNAELLIAQINNGHYKHHEYLTLRETTTKKAENSEESQSILEREWREDFRLSRELRTPASGQITEKSYYYDEEGKLLREEARIGDELRSQRVFTY